MKYRVVTPPEPMPDTNPYQAWPVARVLDDDGAAQECEECGYPAVWIGIAPDVEVQLPVTAPWCDHCVASGNPAAPLVYQEWVIREDGEEMIGLYSDHLQAEAAAAACRKRHPDRHYTVHPYRPEPPINIEEKSDPLWPPSNQQN